MPSRFPKLLIVASFLLAAFTARAEEARFDSDGVGINYRVEGEGEPVLLIHGFGLNGLMQWTKLRRALLEDGYRVIAIDNRGHGKSDKPHDPDLYGAAMIADQVRLLDHLGVDRAHVVGYSMGGGIALQLVIDHPERVQSAVIGGAGWRANADEEFSLRNPLIEDLENERGFGKLFERLASTESTEDERRNMAALGNILTAMNDQKALAAVLRGRWAMTPTEEQVRDIAVPMSIIIGELDPILVASQDLKAAHPAAELIVIPGATHQTTHGTPEFIGGVKTLLATHPLSAAE